MYKKTCTSSAGFLGKVELSYTIFLSPTFPPTLAWSWGPFLPSGCLPPTLADEVKPSSLDGSSLVVLLVVVMTSSSLLFFGACQGEVAAAE